MTASPTATGNFSTTCQPVRTRPNPTSIIISAATRVASTNYFSISIDQIYLCLLTILGHDWISTSLCVCVCLLYVCVCMCVCLVCLVCLVCVCV